MVKDPQLYRVMSSVALADVGHVAYCEHCKNPVSQTSPRVRLRRFALLVAETIASRYRCPGCLEHAPC
jgi:hypothetical protein